MSVHTTTTVTPSVEEDVSTSEVLPDDSTIQPMHTESEAKKDGGTEAMNASNVGTTMIALVSSDQITFPISKAAAKLSGLIVDTLSWDDEEDDDDSNQVEYEPIYLPRVEGDCLQKVVDFLNHSAIDPLPKIQQPLVGNSLHEVVTNPWYQNYVAEGNMNKEMLFRVLAAANFMEIPPLLDLASLWCTFQISGKSPEEIRLLLNLPSMTPEEEARAREEHPWVFETIS